MVDFADFTDEAIGELSKLGKTALDQITGKSPASDLSSKIKQQTNQQTQSLWNEIAKFAQSATAQFSGDKPVTSSEISKMAKKNNKYKEKKKKKKKKKEKEEEKKKKAEGEEKRKKIKKKKKEKKNFFARR